MSTIITELLQQRCLKVEEAEATLLALGVHSDTGSLTFDSATPRCLNKRKSYANLEGLRSIRVVELPHVMVKFNHMFGLEKVCSRRSWFTAHR